MDQRISKTGQLVLRQTVSETEPPHPVVLSVEQRFRATPRSQTTFCPTVAHLGDADEPQEIGGSPSIFPVGSQEFCLTELRKNCPIIASMNDDPTSTGFHVLSSLH